MALTSGLSDVGAFANESARAATYVGGVVPSMPGTAEYDAAVASLRADSAARLAAFNRGQTSTVLPAALPAAVASPVRAVPVTTPGSSWAGGIMAAFDGSIFKSLADAVTSAFKAKSDTDVAKIQAKSAADVAAANARSAAAGRPVTSAGLAGLGSALVPVAGLLAVLSFVPRLFKGRR